MQEGGSAPAPAAQQPAAAQQHLLVEIANMMAQGLQSGDYNMLAQAFLSLLSHAQAPAQEPIGAPVDSEPVFKKGGKLVKRKKCRK